MNDTLTSKVSFPLFPLIARKLGAIGWTLRLKLGLAVILLVCTPVHAECGPTGHASDGQSVSGRTDGREAAAGREEVPETERTEAKRERKMAPESFIERDPSETSEGSGPDPFGRY